MTRASQPPVPTATRNPQLMRHELTQHLGRAFVDAIGDDKVELARVHAALRYLIFEAAGVVERVRTALAVQDAQRARRDATRQRDGGEASSGLRARSARRPVVRGPGEAGR